MGGTIEAANQVVLFEKASGGPDGYGESNRIADLNVDGSFIISNFKGTAFDVTIRVESISNNGRDANIQIITQDDGVPTESPTESCGGVGKFSLELNTDRYSFETSWELIDNESNMVIESAPREDHRGNQRYVYPNDGNTYYCLEESKCYTFKINDSYGDGLNNGEGNYKLYLNNELEYEGGDGNFKSEETYVLCVDDATEDDNQLQPTQPPTVAPTRSPTASPTQSPTTSPTRSPTKSPTGSPTKSPTRSPTASPTGSPTNSPTRSPTTSPTRSPTKSPTRSRTTSPTRSPTKVPTNEPTTDRSPPISCNDQSEFLWKNQARKNCIWAGKGTEKKIANKCNKSNRDGKKVHHYCPATCAKVNQGSCA